jgi:hypothetical protein
MRRFAFYTLLYLRPLVHGLFRGFSVLLALSGALFTVLGLTMNFEALVIAVLAFLYSAAFFFVWWSYDGLLLRLAPADQNIGLLW